MTFLHTSTLQQKGAKHRLKHLFVIFMTY